MPGRPAAQVFVPGLTQFSGGVDATSNQKFNFNAYQIYDDAFLTKGSHSLKFGVAFEERPKQYAYASLSQRAG